MEEKINLAELLKDCPKGMELDCTMCDNVTFAGIDNNNNILIKRCSNGGNKICLSEWGTFFGCNDAKCVIFPKGKTTWEGFVPPCRFKDGDIVSTKEGGWIGITTGGKIDKFIPTYCVLKRTGEFEAYLGKKEAWSFYKLATEEEKQKLFDVIKANGYKWNAETKTLEELIKPKFKVGDRIRHKTTNKEDVYEISKVYDDSYGLVGFTWMIYIKYQDQYELVPNKFDINTLKPFDKVLVRDSDKDMWRASIFSNTWKDRYFCVGAWHNQCIPYDVNKELLGTTDDCEDFYKTWE